MCPRLTFTAPALALASAGAPEASLARGPAAAEEVQVPVPLGAAARAAIFPGDHIASQSPVEIKVLNGISPK